MQRFDGLTIEEISTSSPDYPAAWRALSDAPKTVYAVGDLRLLRAKKVTIVGSRRIPVPAVRLGKTLAKELSQGVVIVTGTADGGDSAAIEGALAGSGKVVCLLAGGFGAVPQASIELIKAVAKRGLVLSPHSYDTEIRAFSYEYRNKLLAALGEGTLVLGAAQKSGTLITAKYAKSMKKPVFAFPYFPGSAAGEGSNALLKAGAFLVENALDVAEKLGIDLRENCKKATFTIEEERAFLALKELGESHVTVIAERAGIPAFKAKGVLSALEVKGYAVSVGGNRYAPV